MTKLQELNRAGEAMLIAIKRLVEEEAEGLCANATEPEFEYPIFKKSKHSGNILKFSGITTAEAVFGDAIRNSSSYFNAHTDTDIWIDVPYNKERDLYHGQVCYCADNEHTHKIDIKFYNAINDCSFSHWGAHEGSEFDYYEAVPYEHIPKKMIDAYSSLEGI